MPTKGWGESHFEVDLKYMYGRVHAGTASRIFHHVNPNGQTSIDKYFYPQMKPKSKNKFLHLNLLENSEETLPAPPGMQFTDDDQSVDKIRLIAHGRGRIEQFATVACYPSGAIEEYDPYSVLDTKKPITGNFKGVGYVTSVAQDFSIGSNVAIASVKSAIFERKPAKIIYRNLHWNHWRVAKVEYLKSDCDKSFNLIE
jgi:hypothetical protein